MRKWVTTLPAYGNRRCSGGHRSQLVNTCVQGAMDSPITLRSGGRFSPSLQLGLIARSCISPTRELQGNFIFVAPYIQSY
ncbi:hypothetical protein J6590_025527 [Homalodisca vitripennis]|nr:hypothetical protein J6590_025527 [Homalodisca vitripennis]